jgi:glutathione peroxidase
MSTLHELSVKTLDGKPMNLAATRGKVVMFVNVASRCGYTPQYKGLEKLHETYAAQGLVMIGVPCNQFGAQEPGDAEAIQSFCSTKYDVTFDLLEKQDVNGKNAQPLFQWLTAQETPNGKGQVQWNFEKFLVGKDGTLLNRWRSGTKPESTELVGAIEAALKA